ncbi:MAG: pyridoxamine 5'-phosphate oxidase family protein, partial [Gemmobacter sp.]
MKDYPKTPISRIRRNPKRAVYDRETVHAILDSALLCHVAYVIDEQPYCTPTIHWREGETLFWHGSSASRMLRAQGKGIRVC